MKKTQITQYDFLSIVNMLAKIEAKIIASKPILTFNEVVAYTGLSKSYLYKMTSAGIIPHSKPNGKQLYFSKDAIDAWLMGNKVMTQKEIESAAINHVGLNRAR